MLLSAASRGVTVTQPEVVTVSEGRDATIECKTEPGIDSWGLHWYQQKPGETPKLIIYGVNDLYDESFSRFSGNGADGTDFTLNQWSPDWRCCTLLLSECILYVVSVVHTVIKSYKNLGQSESRWLNWSCSCSNTITHSTVKKHIHMIS